MKRGDDPLRGRTLIGVAERIDLPGWGVDQLRVKIDTGARTSALHVDDVELLPDDRVRFSVVLDRRRAHRRIVVEAPIARIATVRSSSGKAQSRIFVATTMRLGPIEKDIEISLASREPMIFRMLLGRTALAHDFVVDPVHRYLQSESKPPRRRDAAGRPKKAQEPEKAKKTKKTKKTKKKRADREREGVDATPTRPAKKSATKKKRATKKKSATKSATKKSATKKSATKKSATKKKRATTKKSATKKRTKRTESSTGGAPSQETNESPSSAASASSTRRPTRRRSKKKSASQATSTEAKPRTRKKKSSKKRSSKTTVGAIPRSPEPGGDR